MEIRMSTPSGGILKVGHTPVVLVADDELRKMAGKLTERIGQQLRASAQIRKDAEARVAFVKEMAEMALRERDLPVLSELRNDVAQIGAKTDSGTDHASPTTPFSSIRAEFIKALPPPTTQTDAEGRFEIPTRAKIWMVACSGQQRVVDKVEPLWVRLFDPAEKLPPEPIILSNDSVLDTSEGLYGWLASLCNQPNELSSFTRVEVSPELADWTRAARNKASAAFARRETARKRELRTDREGGGFASPEEEAALSLVKRAVASRDEEGVRECFWLGETPPADIVDYMKSLDANEGRATDFSWAGGIDVSLECVLVEFNGKSGKHERTAMLVPDEHGLWKVDFGAFARISKPAWKNLIEGSTETFQGRMFVQADWYYNAPFENEEEWTCFSLTNPDLSDLLPEDSFRLYGYCKKSSPQEKALKSILKYSNRMERVTLEFSRKLGDNKRQFQITRVLARDWVVSGKAYDEKFK